MSNNTINSVIAQAIIAEVESKLKSVRGTEVSANKRSVWVKAPKKADATLKELGFKYAESKDAWWFTYAVDEPAQTAPKGQKPQKKAEPKPKAEPTQPKAEKVHEEMPEEAKTRIIAYMRKEYPGAECTCNGTWVWVKGEKTRDFKDALKADGFFWSGKREAWYCKDYEKLLTHVFASECAAKCKPVQMPTIAEEIGLKPKAQTKKAQPKAKKVKGGIVNVAGLLG